MTDTADATSTLAVTLETVPVMVASDHHDPASTTGAPLKFPKEAKVLPPEMQHGHFVSSPNSESGVPYGLHLFVDEEVLAETPVGTLIAFPNRDGGLSGEVFEVTAHHGEHRHRPIGEEEERCDSCIVAKSARVIANDETGFYESARKASEAGRRHGEQLDREMNRRKRRQAAEEALAALTPEERSEVLATLSDDELTS